MNFSSLFFFHLLSFFFGFVLDLIFGDPHWRFHPVCLIGNFISFLEKKLNTNWQIQHGCTRINTDKYGFFEKSENLRRETFQTRRRGLLTVILVCSLFMILSFFLLFFSYKISWIFGCVIESILTYFLLALKSLKTESMKVYFALENKTIDDARKAVSMIVGRDTKNLSDEGITKAAVETIAENASDGVAAPMIFLALGGPVLGFFYKCVNTMDSMIGYKNERFIDFGRAAAKLDDFVNFLPSRICALLMIFSCNFLGKDFDAKNAWRIFKRDRFNHESPNSAQTESAMAGALKIKLAGPAFYEGKLEQKPFLGDDLRKIEHKDIKKANKLLYFSSFLLEAILCLIMIFIITFFLPKLKSGVLR